MEYKNSKQGFKKLFNAQILLIAADIIGGLDKKITWVAFGAVGLMIVGFFMNLGGLKLIAKDDEGYKKARTTTLLGIAITVIAAILSAVYQDNTVGRIATDICKDVSDITEFCTAYDVMNTSVGVLNRLGKTDFALNTRKTLNLYTLTYCASIVINLFTDIKTDMVGVILLILGLVTVVLAIIAQIKYYMFLKRMSEEL